MIYTHVLKVAAGGTKSPLAGVTHRPAQCHKPAAPARARFDIAIISIAISH